MGCRCKERGQALKRAGIALVQRDTRTVADRIGYVIRTTAQDTNQLARRQGMQIARILSPRKR